MPYINILLFGAPLNIACHLIMKKAPVKTGAFAKKVIDQDGLMMIRFLPIT